jgi:hypothetical protein
MEAIKNLKMVEAARSEARHLLEADIALSQFPLLSQELAQPDNDIHFE